jgi:AsmA-like C-terminal region
MRLKVPFFGYVLAIVGLLLPSIIFVAVLPSLINTGPVKARLMAELRDWTGGDVKVAGPISIESLFSLSVDLRNVEFGGLQGMTSITGIKAARILARVSWADLLSGQLDFDKIKIYNAVIHARGGNTQPTGGALLAIIAGAHQNPFTTLSLADSVVIFAGAEQPNRKLQIDTATANLRKSDGRIRVAGAVRWKGELVSFRLTTNTPAPARPAVPVPMNLNVDSRLVSGGFNGETSLSGALNAAGHVSLTTPDLPGMAKWAGWRLEEGVPGLVQLTGALNLSPDWVSLQEAAFAVAGHKATGDLTLKFTAAPPRLEGALAFDDLDFGPLWDETLGERRAASSGPSVSRLLMTSLDTDLRVSAEILRWGHAVARPAAFSLTSKAGSLSADIAELGLFDGSVLGHVEADLAREPVRARARLTAENIDTAQILGAVSERPWLMGRADARLEIEAEGRGGKELLDSAKAHARIGFANGGSIPFDIPRLANASPAPGVNGWSELGSTIAEFDELRAQLTLEGGELRCDDLTLRSAGETIRGSGSVDLARQQVDWRFTVRKSAAPGLGRGEAAKGEGDVPPEASLSIRGPWARPIIRAGERSGALSAKRPGALRDALPAHPARLGAAGDPGWD